MNRPLVLFRLLLLPASICVAILVSVGSDLLAKRGVMQLSAANGDGQAIGTMLFIFGVPAFVIGGWLMSRRFKCNRRVLLIGNAILAIAIAWVVIELRSQSGSV